MKNAFKIITLIVISLILVVIYFYYALWKLAPQGHGSKSNYVYNFSKSDLERKVDSVIRFDPIVSRKKLDPYPHDNYYNKDGYFTIILDGIQYCFRYYGDSTYWAESKNSSKIFIASITDVDDTKSAEECIEMVENKFIKKLGDYVKKEK